MQKVIGKPDECVINIAEQTVVDVLETCYVNHNKGFIKGAMKSALNDLLVCILSDSSNLREFFEYAIIQVANAPKLLVIVASATARDTAAMAPSSRYAAQGMKQEVEELVKDLVLTPPSHHWVRTRLPTSQKSHRNKALMNRNSKRSSPSRLSGKGMWSFKKSRRDI